MGTTVNISVVLEYFKLKNVYQTKYHIMKKLNKPENVEHPFKKSPKYRKLFRACKTCLQIEQNCGIK